MDAHALGWWGVPLAIAGGAIRVGTPLLWVSLGETVTEKAGRINLGLEGTLLMGAMTAFAVSLASGSPWLGVLAAAAVGVLFGALHGVLCSLGRVNDTAMGIALMLAGSGLAFWLGKPLIQPSAPGLPAIALGGWTDQPAVKAALSINPLFAVGARARVRDPLGARPHALRPAPSRRRRQRKRGARVRPLTHRATASPRPPSAAPAPASAARRSRSSTRARGARRCRAARA